MTVSRAMRTPDTVSEELRQKIAAAVKRLGYVPNLAASRLASSRSHIIGVVVPTLYNVIFAEYLQALHETLLPAGFQIIVVNNLYSLEEEEKAVRALLGHQVDAIIMVGVQHSSETRMLLKRARIPVVETFQLTRDPLGINIGLDQRQAGHDATQHLLSKGLRRIGFVGGMQDARAIERLTGYKLALEEAQLDPDLHVFVMRKPSRVTLGAEIAQSIAEAGRVPEALYCIDDNVALGAIHEFQRLGIRIPDDVSIIGFHDLEFAATSFPALSSVITHRYKTGLLAAEAALDALQKGKLKQAVVDLGYEIIERQSTGRTVPHLKQTTTA